MILIYTVTASTGEAEKLGQMLLENNLCACINILSGMKSMYRWEGKIESADENILLIKTEREKYAEVEKLLKENHSYEIPAIFSIDVEQVEPVYSAWIKNQLE